VISKDEYLEMFDNDNGYLKEWSDEQKFKLITQINEDGNIVKGTEASWKRDELGSNSLDIEPATGC
jgi:hypothetical protein